VSLTILPVLTLETTRGVSTCVNEVGFAAVRR